jgi:hypothetical protein
MFEPFSLSKRSLKLFLENHLLCEVSLHLVRCLWGGGIGFASSFLLFSSMLCAMSLLVFLGCFGSFFLFFSIFLQKWLLLSRCHHSHGPSHPYPIIVPLHCRFSTGSGPYAPPKESRFEFFQLRYALLRL